ncbi:right-handed parallel beta-helix repeat-containing protein [Natronorarus salvus]|uniref:right-handed parallel beta-helix repeat-containing protein n=1 Tax=Natronorarus salvus TaxID=3117733 RepID=UPI002F2624C5
MDRRTFLKTGVAVGALPAAGCVGGRNGDIDTTGVEEWDVLVGQLDDEGYEAIDAEGEAVVSTANAATALQESSDATPEGGTLVVKGHYEFEDGEEWYIDEDIRILGHGAVLETTYTDDEDGEMFLFVEGEVGSSYGVEDVELVEEGEAHRYVLTLDEDVDDTVFRHHLVMLESVEEAEMWPGGDTGPTKGEGHMVAANAADEATMDDGADVAHGLEDDQISLLDLLEFEYDTSFEIEALHIEPVEVTMEGFDIYGPDVWRPKVGAIHVRGGANCTFRDLSVQEVAYECLTLVQCYDTTVENSVFTWGASNHDGGDGYGVKVGGGTAHTHVKDCTFHMMRHGIAHAGSGQTGTNRRRSQIENCLFTAHRSTALDMHGEDVGHRVIDCTFSQANDECISYGKDTVVRGCTFQMGGNDRADAIYDNGEWGDRHLTVADCTFEDVGRNCIRLQRSDTHFSSVTITGCRFENVTHAVRTNQAVEEFTFTDNTCLGGTDDQLRFAVRDAVEGQEDRPYVLNGGIVANNVFRDVPAASAIRMEYDASDREEWTPAVRDLVIQGNLFGTVADCIRVDGTAHRVSVHGNHAEDCGTFVRMELGGDVVAEDWVVADNALHGVDTALDGVDESDHEVRDGGGWSFE